MTALWRPIVLEGKLPLPREMKIVAGDAPPYVHYRPHPARERLLVVDSVFRGVPALRPAIRHCSGVLQLLFHLHGSLVGIQMFESGAGTIGHTKESLVGQDRFDAGAPADQLREITQLRSSARHDDATLDDISR